MYLCVCNQYQGIRQFSNILGYFDYFFLSHDIFDKYKSPHSMIWEVTLSLVLCVKFVCVCLCDSNSCVSRDMAEWRGWAPEESVIQTLSDDVTSWNCCSDSKPHWDQHCITHAASHRALITPFPLSVTLPLVLNIPNLNWQWVLGCSGLLSSCRSWLTFFFFPVFIIRGV